LVVAICAALLACGGGGGNQAAVKDAFVTAANGMCKQLTTDYNAAKAALPASPSADDLKEFVQGSFGPEAISTYQKIASLQTPKDDAESLSSLLTSAIAEVRLIQSDPVVNGSVTNQHDLVARFRNYGLTECGAGFVHDLTHDEYVTAAQGICKNLDDKLFGLEDDNGIHKAGADAKAAFVHTYAAPLFRDAIDQLEVVGVPTADQAAVTKLLTDWKAIVDSYEKDPTILYTPKTAGVIAFNGAWDAFGATNCGVPDAL
jgi:hypothetical protein